LNRAKRLFGLAAGRPRFRMRGAQQITLTHWEFWQWICQVGLCCGYGEGFLRRLRAVPGGDTWPHQLDMPIRRPAPPVHQRRDFERRSDDLALASQFGQLKSIHATCGTKLRRARSGAIQCRSRTDVSGTKRARHTGSRHLRIQGRPVRRSAPSAHHEGKLALRAMKHWLIA
jgi:hypothetical protein